MHPDAGSPPPEAQPDALDSAGSDALGPAPRAGSARRRGKPVLYPRAYLWLVLVSAMDVMLTWLILHLGGYEANPIAARVIEEYDLWGIVSFKFFLVIVFLLACEFVGRRRPLVGRGMAYIAVCISAVPVAVAVVLLSTRL
jgi:Domain of unknown function (DUF5658)